MKAVVIERPRHGGLVEQPVPRAQAGQVVVRVAAVGVCMSDVETWQGTRPSAYVRYPVTLGHEWSGTVVEVGPDVSGVQVGDRVAVEGHNFCGACPFCRRGQTNLCETYNELGFTLPGAYAEYVVVRADLAHPFRPDLPLDLAALTEPAACAGHGMLRAGVQPGDTVAVVGPGTVGLLGVAWAKGLGAGQIIVVGVDRLNEDFARAVGATEVVTLSEGPEERVRALTGGRGADVVFEAAGHPSASLLALNLVRRGGSVALVGIVGGEQTIALDPDLFCLKDVRVHGIFAYTSEVFVRTLRAIESGLLDVAPLITHRLSLADYRRAFDLLASRSEPTVKILLHP